MKLAHSIVITVFARTEENIPEIKEALVRFVGMDLEKEKLKVAEEKATSAEGFVIMILSITLQKDRHIQEFLERMNGKLNAEDKDTIVKQYLTRVDDDLNFFVRLEKNALIANECKLTDGGNCYHIKMHLASYPAKIELGKEIVKKIFREGTENDRI